MANSEIAIMIRNASLELKRDNDLADLREELRTLEARERKYEVRIDDLEYQLRHCDIEPWQKRVWPIKVKQLSQALHRTGMRALAIRQAMQNLGA